MQEFSLAYSSIPNQKIHINESMMKRILNQQQQNGSVKQAKQFAKLFANVQYDNQSMASDSTNANSGTNGISFAPHSKPSYRYHLQHNILENSQVIHKSPKPQKKIIRSTIPKLKTQQQQSESFVDSKIDIIFHQTPRKQKQRAISQWDKPYQKYLNEFRQQHRKKLESLEEIKVLPYQSAKFKSQEIGTLKEIQHTKIDIQKVRQELRKLIKKEDDNQQEEETEEKEKEKKQYPSHMFIEDDRDRFGQQIYPITLTNKNFPGPGQYDVHNTSLEYRTQKINERNAQKRLLQLWVQQ